LKGRNGEIMSGIYSMFKEFPWLETERFILREVSMEDCKDIYDIYCDEEAVKFQGIASMTSMEQAKKSVNFFLNGFVDKKFLKWCIARKEDNKVIGIITLHHIDVWSFRGEIGYMLNKKFWRQNVMSEAGEKIIKYAFNEVGFNRIEAHVHPDNRASIRLCEKLGFQREGLKKQCDINLRTNEFEDRVMLAVLKSDYKY